MLFNQAVSLSVIFVCGYTLRFVFAYTYGACGNFFVGIILEILAINKLFAAGIALFRGEQTCGVVSIIGRLGLIRLVSAHGNRLDKALRRVIFI